MTLTSVIKHNVVINIPNVINTALPMLDVRTRFRQKRLVKKFRILTLD